MKPYKTEPLFVKKIWGEEIWHTGVSPEESLVLIKFIEAKDILSVQIHPSDEYAARVEGRPRGKDEMWLIVECEQDAEIVYGFNGGISKKELRKLIQNNTLVEGLNFIKVKRGDCVFIPAGTVHTLGKGITVLEIQQSCDLTYRLYDWDRRDGYGRKRELHIEKALDAINYSNTLPRIKNIYDSSVDYPTDIIKCEHFSCIYRPMKHKDKYTYNGGCFRAVTLIEGKGLITFENQVITMEKGDTCIFPENYRGETGIECVEDMECIETICDFHLIVDNATDK